MLQNLEHLTPRDSWLAHRDARWRLAAFVVAIVCVAMIRELGPAAVALGFALVLAGIARVPVRWFCSRIGMLMLALIPFLILVPFTVDRGERIWEWRWLSITDVGVIVAVALATKTVSLVTLALTLLSTAPLHVHLAAAGRLGVPKLLIQITQLTHRYVFLLLDELNRLRVALRVRGFRNAMTMHAYRTVGQVTGTLIVRGSDRSERVAHAMRCRAFDGHFRCLTQFCTTPADLSMFLLVVIPPGLLLAWDNWG